MSMRTVVRAWVAVGVAACALPVLGDAQELPGGGGRRQRPPTEFPSNVPYDGRFTFARIRYDVPMDGFRQDIKWSHDYPRGERHFTKIVGELSTIRVRTAQSNIFALDDPQLTKYPIAYLCEAGYWRPTDAEVLGLRNYLLKGGFIIFDDFAHNDWMNFTAQMQRVLPKLKPMQLGPADKIMDSFYRITKFDFNHPYYRNTPAEFWGYYENNDRSKRLLAMVNYNNDISESWEFSDEGFWPVEVSNEAYKLGINYLIYALTR